MPRKPLTSYSVLLLSLALTVPLPCRSAQAQLQITEVLFDPASSESDWEWIELRNIGNAAIDLDGYWLHDLGNAPGVSADPNMRHLNSGGLAPNTVVPAGGVAVIYDGTALGFDGARFRAAWNLAPHIPLVPITSFPQLNNSGDGIGLWQSRTELELDVADVSPGMDGSDLEIVSFSAAVASIDFRTAQGFPAGDDAASMHWNGNGSYQTGSNWTRSLLGEAGARQSTATFLPGSESRNDTADWGNPGLTHGGSPPAGALLFTEVMYDPASTPEGDWEWVEVLNNTGSTLDFAATPYFFDDAIGNPLASENLTAGTLAPGELGVLFSSNDVTLEEMQQAWGAGITFLPVENFPSLNNDGDTIGLWATTTAYQSDDRETGDFDAAIAVLNYDGGGDWPSGNDASSIFLADLGATNGNGLAADGTAWQRAGVDKEIITDTLSYHPNALFLEEPPVDNSGLDIGSPGEFPGTIPLVLHGDYNDDGIVDAADYTVWRDHLNAPAGTLRNDPNSTPIGNDQYATWKENFGRTLTDLAALAALQGQPVPEPDTLSIFFLAICCTAAGHRWRIYSCGRCPTLD